jgi:hypothetical protein
LHLREGLAHILDLLGQHIVVELIVRDFEHAGPAQRLRAGLA